MALQPVKRLRGIIRKAAGDKAGVAGIEFAIVAPVLALFIAGLIDLGLGFASQMSVSQAAQAGSYYALLKGYDTTGIASAIQNASNATGISGSANQSCGCPSSSGAVASAACGSSCPSGQTAGTYVSVSAQYQYSTILPYPGLTSPMTLSATSMVRIK
jgi:Flp pilus assembly protein TadG